VKFVHIKVGKTDTIRKAVNEHGRDRPDALRRTHRGSED